MFIYFKLICSSVQTITFKEDESALKHKAKFELLKLIFKICFLENKIVPVDTNARARNRNWIDKDRYLIV